MKTYIGTKILNAKPMTRGDYNTLRGWTLPDNENGADEGYLTDNGAGHLQWQPKAVFEDAFDPCNAMNFGMAIAALKMGKRVARSGWNGKGMFLFMRPADKINIRMVVEQVKSLPKSVKDYFDSNDDRVNQGEFGLANIHFGAYICMLAADGSVVNGWLASQTDMLAEDWKIVGWVA